MTSSSTQTRALCLLLLLLALAGKARGDQVDQGLKLAQLRLPGTPLDPRPAALSTLALELAARTSVAVDAGKTMVELKGDAVFAHPFLVLPVDEPLPALSPRSMLKLGAWLQRGGTLLIDYSGDPARVEELLGSVSALVESMLPGEQLERIPSSSIIFRNFYRVRAPTGRIQLFPEIYGVSLGERLAVVVSLNDLLGALDRSRDSSWRFNVVPGGENQREKSIRLGVNLVMYTLCLDYKNEKSHLDYLRSRRNWRLEPQGSEVSP